MAALGNCWNSVNGKEVNPRWPKAVLSDRPFLVARRRSVPGMDQEGSGCSLAALPIAAAAPSADEACGKQSCGKHRGFWRLRYRDYRDS